MRLLKDRGHGELSLVEYYDNIPSYAILSHTWGPDGEEVTFKDLMKDTGKNKAGYQKIDFCRKQAVRDGIQHFWVDTCCIDKANNTELSEAINSMFRWYKKADKCYVYLSDVSTFENAAADHSFTTTWKAAFRSSKWFTRGWTLQELIAPKSVEFFSREGGRLGSKESLEQDIHEITKIAVEALRGGPLTVFEIEERMSWATGRKTRRQEDRAYSLLGIFDIQIPLIYGEGEEKAMARLERKTRKSLKRKSDQDISHDDDQAIEDDVSAIREQKRQRRYDVTDWISSINFAAQQSDIISQRQEGTGIWFTDSPEFLSWVQGSNQTLFCPGIPGAGKTIIAATVVNHLWTHVQDKDVGVAYIYCNYKTQADHKAASLAATILKQLIQERPSIAEPVANLYDRHAGRSTRPSLEEILSALQAVVSSYSKVYVVVDALDECLTDNRTQLLTILRNLQSKGNLSFMATSRFIPEVEQHFTSSPQLAVRANDSDVKRFVAGQMYRLPRCVQRDNKLQEAIQNGISTVVEGMFLLARLHLDSLLDKCSKKKILSTLAEIPKGSEALDEAYNDAIKRIEGQLSGHRTLATNVLSWITYAQRPLTTGELCHALAVESGEAEVDPDNIPDVEDMVSFCAGLVAIDNESNIVRLVHYTTQEYFERIRENWNPRAQQEIASTCLTYLSFYPFRSGSCQNDDEFECRLEKNMFLDYASQYWSQHAQGVQEQVYELAFRFLQDTNLVACAVQTMSISKSKRYREYSQQFPKHTIGLHLTARLGLLYLSKRLLSDLGRNINELADLKDDHGRTPLSRAAEGGHDAVVKLLLETGAVDLNSEDEHGQTALSWAAKRGHEAVVKLLLETGAVDLNSEDEYSQTALSWAAWGGHDAVVKLLLEMGAVDLDSKDVDGRTALSRAAEGRYDAVVKLLLETGAVDLDSNDWHNRTPLSWAAEGGYDAVVKLLLETGAVDLNSEDEHGQTALSWAAKRGHEAVVKLLLETGAVDLNSEDEYSQTALSWAAWGGHDAVVKLLLEMGAVDLDSKDVDGRTALSRAAEGGYDAVVKLLLETGAVDLDSKNDSGRTALSRAAEGGYDAVVKLLLEAGAVDLDSNDICHGQTALSWAAKRGHDAVVKLLLETGAVDLNSEDEHGQTALSWAAKRGHDVVVKLLLKAGAVDLDSNDIFYGQTALSWAAWGGHDAVVKLLLETGAVDLDSKNDSGRTALSRAAEGGYDAVVKLLLEAGAVDLDSNDICHGQTALSWAAKRGHDAVVKLLLETGAVDLNSEDEHGQTALSWAAKRGHDAVVKLLLEAGAVDLDLEDEYSQTALS